MGWKWNKAPQESGVIWGDKVGSGKVVVLVTFGSEAEADAALEALEAHQEQHGKK